MNSRTHISTLSLIICALLLNLSIDSAFTQSNRTTFWLNGGLGVNSLGSLAGSANVSLQLDKYIYALRATANSENAELFGGGDEFFDTGLLFGLATKSRKKFASIAIGIARVTGNRYEGKPGLFGGGKRVNIAPTVGFPVEVQLFLRPASFFGVGTYIYGNLNSEQSFGGITLCLQLGKLR